MIIHAALLYSTKWGSLVFQIVWLQNGDASLSLTDHVVTWRTVPWKVVLIHRRLCMNEKLHYVMEFEYYLLLQHNLAYPHRQQVQSHY